MDLMNVTWGKMRHQERTPDAAEFVRMSVRVVPDWKRSVYLEWIPPTHPSGVDPGDPMFMVYSSDSELGPFRTVTAEPILDPFYTTSYTNQDRKTYEEYFTIEVIWPDKVSVKSYPQTAGYMFPDTKMGRIQNKQHLDIMRREAILLDKFAVGMSTVVCTPKIWGERCKVCWDPVYKKVMDDQCETCYGTGYEGGYNTGMRTKIAYGSIDPQMTYTYFGEFEPTTISAWTIAFPLLNPHAILLREADRRAFRIEGHQGSTEFGINMQRQNVIIKELNRDAIEYQLFNRTDVQDIPLRQPHVHQ
jgi:hypothetical protein